MNYLLDTNILIYTLCNPSALSDVAKQIISLEPNINVSIASFWEIAIKQTLGKLNIKLSIQHIAQICISRNINILPISSNEIEGIKELPFIHKDPFDRLIVSQAIKNDLCLVTSDQLIPKYDVRTAW